MSICIEVWGDYALFTRPEFKAERVSYDVMTPSAAVGLLESIFWHPGVKYIVDRIHVCNPIRHFNIRRNERGKMISLNKVRNAMAANNCELTRPVSDENIQRANTALKDVRYVIEAHIEMTEGHGENDSLAKYYAMFERRCEKGQCFRQPVFGIREYAAHFKPCIEIPNCPDELIGVVELGWVLHHIDFSNTEKPRAYFFEAVLENGILTVPHWKTVERGDTNKGGKEI